jgi:hypothetical protein
LKLKNDIWNQILITQVHTYVSVKLEPPEERLPGSANTGPELLATIVMATSVKPLMEPVKSKVAVAELNVTDPNGASVVRLQ